MTTINLPFRLASLLQYHVVTTPVLPPPTALGYEYLVARNGIFLRATNPSLTALIPIHAFPTPLIRGLVDLQPVITLHHLRLPVQLLETTLADARTQTNATGDLVEGLYFFTSHAAGTKFSVLKPAQRAGVTHVIHEHLPTAESDPVLLELHTHGTLPAFWSATDTQDEQGFRFYAVVGNLDTAYPIVRLRLGIYGYFYEVPLSVLFDIPEDVEEAMSAMYEKGGSADVPPNHFI
jgi:PRTRC genetic system protein A